LHVNYEFECVAKGMKLMKSGATRTRGKKGAVAIA